MNAKEFLKHKGIFDTQYIVDCDGESIELEKLLIEYQALQLQQTCVSGSTFIAISKETGKGYFFEYSDMSLWENDDSVDIYEVKYYR